MIGLIGRKIGMTQIYKETGEVCPATALEVGPCPIVQIKKSDGKDGYNAIKLGFWESEKISKPLKGIMSKIGKPGHKVLGEFLLDEIGNFEAGAVLKADVFNVGDIVSIKGTIKGRGFAGVVKRHGFHGGDDTHGCRSNRVPGSISGSSDPSRVYKGKKMPGHYGASNMTIRGLEVIMVDPDKNLIFVKGAVPGPRQGIVYVTKQE